ncbi:class I adenylate-forming enzyme family protein [Nocardia bhagyanarayanae]|uniref:Long-chain acyl-CoA synthetase n=1 Tax=Nocardia bhagyanarayanae TaxID=1215925 RepID=A0A543EXY2_9NOCA|nr:AMP-binding protein [Nocardia bhagyanarayanae]TQM26431.1 long-chain acyl-CoA synthetase [Nocardia bhagyanarayanae]
MSNLIDPIIQHAEAHPERVAIHTSSGPWSYDELLARSLRYAGLLAAHGIGAGDRVLLAAPSCPEFVVAYMGIQALGATVVPINTMSTEPEAAYYLTDAGATLAISWHEVGPAVSRAADGAGIIHLTLTTGADTDSTPLAWVIDRDPAETAAILYTSGTTGRPKGAELGVANLLAAGQIGCAVAGTSGEDRTGTALPLFHVFGQAAVMMATFTGGGSLSLLPKFTPQGLIDLLRRDKLTVMCGVPTMWNAMLHAADDADSADFATLRVAVSGGASLPGEVARAFEEKFGCTILEGYGLTETTAFGAFNDVERGGKIGSVGRVVPRLDMQIRTTDGAVCGPGEVGEIFVRGDTVFKGYRNRPDATAAALTADGWFRTGDLGVFDAEHDLRIVDRLKDMIIRGGYNVYPSEVEEVLYAHPDVVEAAVVGIPDEYYGEEVAAVVTPRSGSVLTAADLDTWTRERLSAYKIPRIIQFVEQLPKGTTGKILKRDIDRDQLRAAAPSRDAKAVRP